MNNPAITQLIPVGRNRSINITPDADFIGIVVWRQFQSGLTSNRFALDNECQRLVIITDTKTRAIGLFILPLDYPENPTAAASPTRSRMQFVHAWMHCF